MLSNVSKYKLCEAALQLPSSSTKTQRKMNDTIVSPIMTGIAKISTDTSPCPNCMGIISTSTFSRGNVLAKLLLGCVWGRD